MMSSSFQMDLFTEPENYEEGPLRDRKQLIKLWERDVQVKFLRHVIALANSARLFGKPAYLLIGIDDNGNLCGAGEMIEHYLADHPSTLLAWEQIKKVIGQIIRDYIDPVLSVEFKSNLGDPFLAYVLIPCISSPTPFQVKKDFGGQRESLRRGDCCIRFGESSENLENKSISPTEAPYAYSFREMPFIFPSQWRRFLGKILNDQDYLRSVHIEGYQKLGCRSGNTIDVELKNFLESEEQLLVITAGPGTGKTTFLKRLIYNLSNESDYILEGAVRRGEFLPPPFWIPVFYSLRGLDVNDYQAFLSRLSYRINQIGKFWDNTPTKVDQIFETRDLKWLICLDGFDEIWSQDVRVSFLSALRVFLMQFHRVKVLLTSRPGYEFDYEDLNGQLLEINSFSEADIESYISTSAQSIDQLEIILNSLKAEEDLWKLISIPRNLEVSIPYLLETSLAFIGQSEPYYDEVEEKFVNHETERESAQIPCAKVLDVMYPTLWERERRRRSFPPNYIDNW